MLETVSKKIAPQEEQRTINLMAAFGWRVVSSQEINNTDSHLERRGDALYNVTTKENYVKLLFQRDTARKNYARIVQLEREYYSIYNAQPQLSTGKIGLGIVVALLTIWMAGIPGIYIIHKNGKKYKEEYGEWLGRMNTRGNAILGEVRTLL